MISIRNLMLFLIVAAMLSCGGKLSDNERKALQEEMNRREIRQIRDEEIVNQSLILGEELRNDTTGEQMIRLGAERQTYSQRPSEPELAALWEAYEAAWENDEDPGENIQRDYPDWLLYTYSSKRDSSWTMEVIRIPRKSVILNLQSE
jgi:hypothetical protein